MPTTKEQSSRYEFKGDIIAALNHIDQARAEFPKGSYEWRRLGYVYATLNAIPVE